MHLLITRPLEDGEKTARLLAARGHTALLAPLMAVRLLPRDEVAPPPMDDVQAILATSANGVRAFAARSPVRAVPLFAVGPQTAAAAQEEGFADVRSADGDAAALAEAVTRWARPDAGALLHVCGRDAPGLLAAALEARNFRVARAVLYAVDAATAMPDNAAAALRAGAVQGVLLFSPHSARIFADCVTRESLPVAGLTAICISPAAAAALAGLSGMHLKVAAAPNQDAIFACFEP